MENPRPSGHEQGHAKLLSITFSLSGPQIKNPYISLIHKDFSILPLYQGFKSGKRDSDPRPSAWEADALPTELFPQMQRQIYGFFPLFRHLKGQKNDDSEKTPTFFRTDTAAQYECRREGKGREGKGREGKGREGKARQGKARQDRPPCRSSAADKRGKTSLLAPATKPRTTEQNVIRKSREKPTSPPAAHSIFSTARNASCGTSTLPT